MKKYISLITAIAIATSSVNAAGVTTRAYPSASENVLSFGSFRYRTSGNTLIAPFRAQAPKISAGCSGIDIALGGLGFAGFQALIDNLDTLMTGAISYAFNLALSTVCKQCKEVLEELQAIADAINSINFEACDAGYKLGSALAKMAYKDGADKTEHETPFNTAAREVKEFLHTNVTTNLNKFKGYLNDLGSDGGKNAAVEIFGVGSAIYNITHSDPNAFSKTRLLSNYKAKDKKDALNALFVGILGDAIINYDPMSANKENAEEVYAESKLPQISLKDLKEYYVNGEGTLANKEVDIWVTPQNASCKGDVNKCTVQAKQVSLDLDSNIPVDLLLPEGATCNSGNKKPSITSCLAGSFEKIVDKLANYRSPSVLNDQELELIFTAPTAMIDILNDLAILKIMGNGGSETQANIETSLKHVSNAASVYLFTNNMQNILNLIASKINGGVSGKNGQAIKVKVVTGSDGSASTSNTANNSDKAEKDNNSSDANAPTTPDASNSGNSRETKLESSVQYFSNLFAQKTMELREFELIANRSLQEAYNTLHTNVKKEIEKGKGNTASSGVQ